MITSKKLVMINDLHRRKVCGPRQVALPASWQPSCPPLTAAAARAAAPGLPLPLPHQASCHLQALPGVRPPPPAWAALLPLLPHPWLRRPLAGLWLPRVWLLVTPLGLLRCPGAQVVAAQLALPLLLVPFRRQGNPEWVGMLQGRRTHARSGCASKGLTWTPQGCACRCRAC